MKKVNKIHHLRSEKTLYLEHLYQYYLKNPEEQVNYQNLIDVAKYFNNFKNYDTKKQLFEMLNNLMASFSYNF